MEWPLFGRCFPLFPKKQPKAALPSRKLSPEQGKKLSNQGRNVCHVANIVTSKIKVGNSEESVL